MCNVSPAAPAALLSTLTAGCAGRPAHPTTPSRSGLLNAMFGTDGVVTSLLEVAIAVRVRW